MTRTPKFVIPNSFIVRNLLFSASPW